MSIHISALSEEQKSAFSLDEKAELIRSMEDYAEEQLGLLLSVERAWQPMDFMPDPSQEGWLEQVEEIRETSKTLSGEVLVTLVGDMVTEEALPSYQTMLNRFSGVEDPTGDAPSAWARWSRGWTAEENRHGDLLNRFLYLTGRVNMRSIETTIHHLLKNGFNPGTDSDPYQGFIYTSFQERATKISHNNVGILARESGCPLLGKICAAIAGDEARHEEAYKKFMDRIFEVDPRGAVIAFRDMMKKTIGMPAKLMEDGQTEDLFKKFSAVAEKIGVYTAHDYADIIDHLVARWKLNAMTGLHGEMAKAQDYVCTLAERYRKLAERFEKKMIPVSPADFAWVQIPGR